VIEALHGIQHDFQGVILNTSHTHQGEWCLESLFCRGPAEGVLESTGRLRDFDGVRRVKVVVIRVGAD
jgi:CopG family nickel-responsive transcriptional regulator